MLLSETLGDRPPLVAVVGTGTGVGKTHVSCALLSTLVRDGVKCVGLKPVESGYRQDADHDAGRLAAAGSREPAAPLYQFAEPVSPHLAARRAGVELSTGAIADWVTQQWNRGGYQVVVVETAGGLLSPLGVGVSNMDAVAALRPDKVLVVGSDRLGVLHNVAAVLMALEGTGLSSRAVVALSAPAQVDESTGTNAEELATLGLFDKPVVFPRDATGGAGSEAAGRALAAQLGLPDVSRET
jgi:dethiobiotin synthetase